jgi:hypothetical protein
MKVGDQVRFIRADNLDNFPSFGLAFLPPLGFEGEISENYGYVVYLDNWYIFAVSFRENLIRPSREYGFFIEVLELI